MIQYRQFLHKIRERQNLNERIFFIFKEISFLCLKLCVILLMKQLNSDLKTTLREAKVSTFQLEFIMGELLAFLKSACHQLFAKNTKRE